MFTVNVEIFVCIKFRGFTKMGKKRELHENMNNANIFTFAVYIYIYMINIFHVYTYI